MRPRLSSQHRVEIHLFKSGSPVVDRLAGDDLEAVDQRLGEWSPVALDKPGDDIGASAPPALALGEHGVGLADTRGRAQVDAEMTGRLDLAGGIYVRLRGLAHGFAGPSESVSLICSVISAAFLYVDRPSLGPPVRCGKRVPGHQPTAIHSGSAFDGAPGLAFTGDRWHMPFLADSVQIGAVTLSEWIQRRPAAPGLPLRTARI